MDAAQGGNMIFESRLLNLARRSPMEAPGLTWRIEPIFSARSSRRCPRPWWRCPSRTSTLKVPTPSPSCLRQMMRVARPVVYVFRRFLVRRRLTACTHDERLDQTLSMSSTESAACLPWNGGRSHAGESKRRMKGLLGYGLEHLPSLCALQGARIRRCYMACAVQGDLRAVRMLGSVK